jgi:diguanylate cyclase (GGDEF)-like protein
VGDNGFCDRQVRAQASVRAVTHPTERFRDATPAARAFVAAAVCAAVVLPTFAPEIGGLASGIPEPLVVLIILVCSVISVEVGWIVEGRSRVEQRPHKALSVWAFAVVLSVYPVWLLVVVPLTYAHVYWRGLRPPLWKWVGSAAFVTLAAVAASETLSVGAVDVSLDSDLGALLTILASMIVFVAVESGLFFVMTRMNHADHETWLRDTLAHPSFYLTEFGLLAVGAISVLVWSHSAWAGILLIPVYGFVQQAVVFEPLRTEALNDGKTGLLRYEPWRAMSAIERDRMNRDGRPWAVVFVDLDHFGRYNELHGHLGGDEALVRVAAVLKQNIRKPDLVCRFGGEEFAVLLVSATCEEAMAVGERLRAAIADLPGAPLTGSVGVAAAAAVAGETVELAVALSAADRALYEAKAAGRNTVIVRKIHPDQEPERIAMP